LWAVAHIPIIFDIFIPLFYFFILFADFSVNFMRQGWRLRTIMWGKKNFLLDLLYLKALFQV